MVVSITKKHAYHDQLLQKITKQIKSQINIVIKSNFLNNYKYQTCYKNYISCNHLQLRLNKKKQDVFKKIYLEEVKASAKSKVQCKQ